MGAKAGKPRPGGAGGFPGGGYPGGGYPGGGYPGGGYPGGGYPGGGYQPYNYNYNQIGISPSEQQTLQSWFVSGDRNQDGRIDRNEFVSIYAQLNPGANGPSLQQYADRAMAASDTNRDGFISFDEFVAAYVLSRTSPQQFPQAATNLLNQYSSNPGYLTPQEAQYFTNWAHNYYGSPVGVQPQQVLTQFHGQELIPIESFVEVVSPLYSPHIPPILVF